MYPEDFRQLKSYIVFQIKFIMLYGVAHLIGGEKQLGQGEHCYFRPLYFSSSSIIPSVCPTIVHLTAPLDKKVCSGETKQYHSPSNNTFTGLGWFGCIPVPLPVGSKDLLGDPTTNNEHVFESSSSSLHENCLRIFVEALYI